MAVWKDDYDFKRWTSGMIDELSKEIKELTRLFYSMSSKVDVLTQAQKCILSSVQELKEDVKLMQRSKVYQGKTQTVGKFIQLGYVLGIAALLIYAGLKKGEDPVTAVSEAVIQQREL